jgi:hypothetical protein
MNLLEPNLGFAHGGRVVYSSLYDQTDPPLLTQDLLLVELSDGTHIDFSWAPEHDPAGAFYVTVFRGPAELFTTKCREPHEAIALVEDLAAKFSSSRSIGSSYGGG